jgi:hypothetical protein
MNEKLEFKSSRPEPKYDVNSSAPPLDLISSAQNELVKFAKGFADTIYYAQQMQPEELDSPTAGASSSSSSSSVMVDERNAGEGVAKILNLGAALSRDFEDLVTSIQQVPDYAAAYSNDEEYEKRLLSITKDEREGPRETLRRGIDAGRKRLRNIDAVLCAATKYALNEPLYGVAGRNYNHEDINDDDDDDYEEKEDKEDITINRKGGGVETGEGVERKEGAKQKEGINKTLEKQYKSHFDRLQIVGPDHDKPFIR